MSEALVTPQALPEGAYYIDGERVGRGAAALRINDYLRGLPWGADDDTRAFVSEALWTEGYVDLAGVAVEVTHSYYVQFDGETQSRNVDAPNPWAAINVAKGRRRKLALKWIGRVSA